MNQKKVMKNTKDFKYVVNINFKGYSIGGAKNIVEPVETLEKGREYSELIDDTVFNACIVEKTTRNVIEWLKRG